MALSSKQLPLVETFGASLGGLQKFGDLALSLHGTLDRTAYQNATLSDGSIEDLASDDYNDWGLRARAEYRMSPAVTPFVETGVDARRYDYAVDFNGYARSSDGALGRAGATLALTGQLTGDASFGYGERPISGRAPARFARAVDRRLARLVGDAADHRHAENQHEPQRHDQSPATPGVSRAATPSICRMRCCATSRSARAPATPPMSTSARRCTIRRRPSACGPTTTVPRPGAEGERQPRSNMSRASPDSNYVNDIFMLGLRLQR